MPPLKFLVSKKCLFLVVKVHSRMLSLKVYVSSNYKELHGLGPHDPEHSRPKESAVDGPHVKINLLHGLSVLDRGVSGHP